MTVDNESYRPWIDGSNPRIVVTQTVPARIAALPVPALGPYAGGAVGEASRAVAHQRDHATGATGVLGHLSAVLIRADAVASSQIEQITTSSEAPSTTGAPPSR